MSEEDNIPQSSYPRSAPESLDTPAGKKLNILHLALITLASVIAGLFLKSKFGGDWYEFAGFVTGIVGVYLVAVEHIINWPVGLLNVSIYAWVFFMSRLYADMTLQIFFFVLGVLGWIQWARGGTQGAQLTISRIKPMQWLYLGGCWAVGTAIYVPIITHFNGAAPFIDSSLTVASIVAQLMTNAKKLENWIVWIVVDATYIPLYISRQLVATAVLYGIFLALAISGLIGWYRTHRALLIAKQGIPAEA